MTTQESTGRRVVVVDGCRIPFQRMSTGYIDAISYELARFAIKGLMDKTQVPAKEIDRVILGTVISNITTSNVARDALLGTGLSHTTPAYTVTMACISANVAITNGVDLIRTGQADVVIAGGTDSSSDIPIRYQKKFRKKLIESQKYRKPMDYLKFFKGLSWKHILPEVPSISEFSTSRTMGQDCERLVSRIGVTREEQDQFAMRSHLAAAEAIKNGFLSDEIVPIPVPPKFNVISEDNIVRGDTTMKKLKSLKPAFSKPHGTITPGNASSLTDGAAVVLIMEEEKAKALGFTPKAYIKAYDYSGQDPDEELLLGPAYATSKVLDRTGLKLDDIGVFEFHEAFAGQVIANLKCLDSDQFAKDCLGKEEKIGEVPMDKLNTLGGSLSIGHPFGATGARLVTTAVNRLCREDAQFALVAACAAGAQGSAIIFERYKS